MEKPGDQPHDLGEARERELGCGSLKVWFGFRGVDGGGNEVK